MSLATTSDLPEAAGLIESAVFTLQHAHDGPHALRRIECAEKALNRAEALIYRARRSLNELAHNARLEREAQQHALYAHRMGLPTPLDEEGEPE